MSTIKTNAILDASGGNTTTINGTTPNAYNTMGKNRIINGAMEIDQRNNGASVNTDQQFPVDRFNHTMQGGGGVLTSQRSTDAPDGFYNSLLMTVSTASALPTTSQYGLDQKVEGYNVSDFMYGTANAKTTTVSFWVKSSITGSFGFCVRNQQASSRTYGCLYTISSANTWEYKTIVIPGDTTGTWDRSTSTGFRLTFSLGVSSDRQATADSWQNGNYSGVVGETPLASTSGATFYITGVQLEVGSVATEFERRPYGMELALCQRYAVVYSPPTVGSYARIGVGTGINSTDSRCIINLPVPLRTTPSVSYTGSPRVENGSTSSNWTTIFSIGGGENGTLGCDIRCGSFTSTNAAAIVDTGSDGNISFSAEL